MLGYVMGFRFWEEVTLWPQSAYVAYLVRFEKTLKCRCCRRRSGAGWREIGESAFTVSNSLSGKPRRDLGCWKTALLLYEKATLEGALGAAFLLMGTVL